MSTERNLVVRRFPSNQETPGVRNTLNAYVSECVNYVCLVKKIIYN